MSYFKLRDVQESDLYSMEGYEYIANLYGYLFVLCTLADEPDKFFEQLIATLPVIPGPYRLGFSFSHSDDLIKFEFLLKSNSKSLEIPIWCCELWNKPETTKSKFKKRPAKVKDVGLLIVEGAKRTITKKYNIDLGWMVGYFINMVNLTTKFVEKNIPEGTITPKKEGVMTPPIPLPRNKVN